MFEKNSIGTGLVLGGILPAISWVVFEYILHNDAFIMDKPAVPYLIAVGLNLVLLRYCLKNQLEDTGKGVMMFTFAFMLVVFLFKIHIR
ncbi:hypothetical protein [Mucilaginibacter psychrotolerans]|uniref:Stationary phase survival protein SurE n=1 Tax=Mucilaginibacter psychrotolerans TaxID=1524096 RepID=A0A4Y8SNH1_9SPHI|nr:hypothetical protein [Mucilaginibacter psychrotolerans]TFF40663.1 hypothetical protein E2R66_00315 [Mucilaginibacter psychrotolerans]